MADVVFWALGVIAVATGIAVFVTGSMARASYALMISFVAVGVAVVLLQQSYVGVIVVLMMLMEMAVMAVYMVMYMGMNPALMPMSMVHSKRTALIVAVIAFGVLATGALLVPWPVRPVDAVTGVTAAIGAELMSSKVLVMLTISPAVVATMVAGIVLANPRGRYDRFGDDLRSRGPESGRWGGSGR